MGDINKDTVQSLRDRGYIDENTADKYSSGGGDLDNAPEVPQLAPQEQPTPTQTQDLELNQDQVTYADVGGNPLVVAPEIANAPVETQENSVLRAPVEEEVLNTPEPASYPQKREQTIADIEEMKEFGRTMTNPMFPQDRFPDKDHSNYRQFSQAALALKEEIAIKEATLTAADGMHIENVKAEEHAAIVNQEAGEAGAKINDMMSNPIDIYQARDAEQNGINERLAEIERRQAASNKKMSDLGSRRIDPGRVWKNKSTANKIFAILGAGFSKGDIGIKAIQHEIDNDIEAQKFDLENERQSLMNTNKQIGLDAKQIGKLRDPTQDEDFAAIESLTNAIGNIESYKANLKPGDPRLAKINAMQNSYKQQLQQVKVGMVKRAQASDGKLGIPDFRINNSTMTTDQKYENLIKDQRDRWNWSTGTILSTKEDASALKKSDFHSSMVALDSLDELMELGRKGSKMSLTDRARVDVIRAGLQGDLRISIVGPGALSEPELKILKSIVANPLKLNSLKSIQIAKLQQIKTRVANLANKTLKEYGLSLSQIRGKRKKEGRDKLETWKPKEGK